MQRRSFFILIALVQFAIVGAGLWFAGGLPAGAAKDPLRPAEATAPPTIAVAPTSTATHPPATSTAAPTVPPCVINFSDVHASDYFYDAVRRLYCAGAVSGYRDNSFRPFSTATRGQLVKIIVLAQHLSPVNATRASFSDVAPANPFYAYIETAAARGIVSGYADGTFKWYNNVTRGQLCKIVTLAEGWTLQTPATATFTDVAPGNIFFSYVETASAHGAVSGYSTAGVRTFRWGANATRGQIAKVVDAGQTQ